MSKIDPLIVQRLSTLVRPFFFGDLRWYARGLLFLLVILSLAIKGMDVLMSYIGRDFMTALSLRQKDEFITQLYLYLLAFCVATPIIVFVIYTQDRLTLLWRKWLTRLIIGKYFEKQSYYRLGWYEGIDNPDQRIEEDIRSFTSITVSLFLRVLQSTISLVAFVGILSSISIYLTLGAVLYALAGSICAYFLGRPLINLNYLQLKKEADYRYKLIHVRENAESIAFYRGEEREQTRVRQLLKIALSNMLSIINRNRLLNFFTTGYNYVTIVLPTVIVAPLYFDNKIEFGEVTQATMAFAVVLNALSIIVQDFGSLSSFAAVVRRLGAFWEALEETKQGFPVRGSEIAVRDGDILAFDNVTILTPARDRVLIKGITFKLERGMLFVTGASGSGKSSLLRVTSGVWNCGEGQVERPPLSKSMYVPQRPYMVVGNLRAQLLYGCRRHGVLDSELRKLLELVGLGETFDRVGGFEAEVDWSSMLSTGEQQRVAFARIALSKPSWVFLDEASTALDNQSEEKLYELIKEFTTGIVTVGYRPALRKLHDSTLVLPGGGKWHLEQGDGQ